MRGALLILVVVAACGGGGAGGPPSCPAQLTDGDTCGFSGPCWHADDFSSCNSGWCTCVNGHAHCGSLSPHGGEACGDEPITSCSYEGNPGCTTAPTSEFCSCADGQSWHCTCACYGGQSTCGGLCDAPPSVLQGALCGEPGGSCAFPGNVTCRCAAATPGAEPTFQCT